MHTVQSCPDWLEWQIHQTMLQHIQRIHKTGPQKNLTLRERQNNLKKAFNIGRNDVKLYDRIILVDDIYTTGTTLDEIAALLKSHGVSEVYCVTLACGAGL